MTMAALQDDQEHIGYSQLVKAHFSDRLQRRGLDVPGYTDATSTLNDNQFRVAMTLRKVGDELEQKNSSFFENMCDQLNITQNTAYNTFKGIADEIFQSEKNWGRIVAFLTFGSTLAIHCASRNDMGFPYVDRIALWVATYMENNLHFWIMQNGNWNGFLEFFDRNDVPENGNAIQNGFFMSALAGVGIGALLMMSFK